MMGDLTLAQEVSLAVARLTRTTPQLVVAGGDHVLYLAPALLGELRAAAHPSGESSSGSVSVTAGAPASLDALDLMVRLETEINRAYWLVRDASRRPGFGGYTLEERLEYAAARVLENEGPVPFQGPGVIRERVLGILADAPKWVRSIERFFDPPKVIPLTGHACPVCWAAKTAVQIEPGEFVEQAALTVTFGAQLVAACGECGARWPGDQMLDLAAQIGGDTQVMQHVLGKAADGTVS